MIKHCPADGDTARLIQALFFARWCNRDTTLASTHSNLLSHPNNLKKHLTSGTANFPQPWCNETAYPVETITWKGVAYSRLDSATHLFHKAAPWLLQTIKEAAGDVVKATYNSSRVLGGACCPNTSTGYAEETSSW